MKSDIDTFQFDLVFVKPGAVSLEIFCINVKTDYYNGHPRHFGDELQRPSWNEFIWVSQKFQAVVRFIYT